MHIINSLSLASYNRSPKIVKYKRNISGDLEQQDRKTVKNKKKLSDNYQGTRTASGYAVPKCKITQYRSSQKHVTGNLQSI